MLLIFEDIMLTRTDGWMSWYLQYISDSPFSLCIEGQKWTCSQITNLLQNFVVEFEGPELQTGCQGIDGGQG